METGKLAVRDAGELVKADAEAAREYMENSRSEATRRAYASDWRIFTAWAEERNIASLPASPEAVCTFMASQA